MALMLMPLMVVADSQAQPENVGKWSPLGFGVIIRKCENDKERRASLSLPGSSYNVYGLDTGIMGAHNDIAGIAAFLVVGGANHNVYGVQVGGFGSGAHNAYGIQVSGYINFVKDSFCGVQIAAGGNVVEGNCYGAQIGLANMAHKGAFVQVGLWNIASDGTFLQIGLFNAEKAKYFGYGRFPYGYPLIRAGW